VTSMQGGAEAPPAIRSDGLQLIERLGDSALVSLGVASSLENADADPETQPASLLLMKGEAGWRIRDYLS
jgi:hypothetical protein